jgi:hypothetical protein
LWLDPADRRPDQRVWSLTWPLMAANALDLALGLIDLGFVRPFGPPATAAIAVGRAKTNTLLPRRALANSTGRMPGPAGDRRRPRVSSLSRPDEERTGYLASPASPPGAAHSAPRPGVVTN